MTVHDEAVPDDQGVQDAAFLLRGDIGIAWSMKEPFCPGKGLLELKYFARLCIIKKKLSAHLCAKVRFIV